LNATLWLAAPFNSNISHDRGQINYGIFIDADANNKTGVGGIDYQVEVSGKNRTWSKTFSQWSTFGTNRTLSNIDNYSGFYAKNGKYVSISLDLNAIGSPDRYRVMFYAEQIKGPTWLIYPTNWIYIPQPEFNITSSPDNIDISQGNQKNVLVKVKSTTGFHPTIHLYTDQRNIDLNFNPAVIHVPSYGMNSSDVSIRVPSSTDLGPKTTNIFANASFPDEPFIFPSPQSVSSSNFNLKLPYLVKSQNLTKELAITINVQPPWQAVLDWLNKWQFPITFVSGIIVGNNVVPWLYNKIRKRNANKKGQDTSNVQPKR